MPVRLVVTKGSGSSEPDEYSFDQDPITIGRGSANLLTLPDEKRIVSKEHAEIRGAGNTFQIVDLGSKNFTFLNGKRLQPERAYDLQEGDTVRIGDFEIQFEQTASAPEPQLDRTVFDARFANPFEDDAAQLAETLQRICRTFDDEVPNRRDDELRSALRDVLEEKNHQAKNLVAELLGSEDAADRSAVPKSPSAQREAAAAEASAQKPKSTAAPREAGGSPLTQRHDELIDTLLEAIAKLVGIPWRFRHEFIGQTIVQSEEAAFLYEGDAKTLKEHLLRPTVSQEELDHRLTLVEEAVEDLVVHQVAMLDGYKASVQKGAQRLLDELDPAELEQALIQEGMIYRLLPPLAKMQVAQQLEERVEELRAEDWSVAERRTFRPAFIKAYLARMTSSRT